MDYINLRPNQEVNEQGLVYEVGSLYDYLSKIHDPRKAKGKRYALQTLLVLTLLAKLGGEDKPSGIAECRPGGRRAPGSAPEIATTGEGRITRP